MDQETNKPQGESTFPAAPMAEKSSLPMIAAIIGLVVVLLGAGWFAMEMMKPTQELGTTAPVSDLTATDAASDTASAALSTQGSSDDVTSIEADLKATNMSSLDDINKI